MSKYIQEMQNKYSCGHEQREKRPYLVVYENNDYILGFPFTTQILKHRSSHKNPTISVGNLNGQVMIDQLQFIYKIDFTHLLPTQISNIDYQKVISSFISQIIKANENPNKDEPNCPSFYDIISFAHNIPKLSNINKWLVVSSKHFNVYATMCFIVPYDDANLDFSYLHSIDWKSRKVQILGNANYTNQTIQTLQQDIRSKF